MMLYLLALQLYMSNCVFFQVCHWPMYYLQAKNIDDAFDNCNEVLAAEPDNVDALCDRAETYINNEQYEEGTSLHSDDVFYSPVLQLTFELLLKLYCYL